MEVDKILRSVEFNQRLGQALLEWAREGRAEAYKAIKAAGSAKAVQTMANWASTELPLVYVRDFLEELIDVDPKAKHVDAMDMVEFDIWCERADEYDADKKKALIPRTGYKQWFLDKWYSEVEF